MKKWFAVLLVILSLTTVSCKTVLDWSEKESTVMELGGVSVTDCEVRFVALHYKCLYETYYVSLLTENFWDQKVDEGATFEDFVKQDSVRNELSQVLYLNSIAAHEKIVLSEDRKQSIKAKANRLYASLSDDEKAYVTGDEESLYRILVKYELAYETEKKLLEGQKIEIADEATRVADIQVIHTKTAGDAHALLARIKSGENFGTLAKENTIDSKIEYSVSRSDIMEPLDSVIFSLAKGEVSEVVEFNDSAYIFRISESYNTLLSLNNKQNLLAQLKYDNLTKVAAQYNISAVLRVNHTFFENLHLKAEGDFPAFSLFAETE